MLFKNTLPTPIAAQKAYYQEIHGQQLHDNYHWMRLSDEQKNALNPDSHTQEVLDYLNVENDYTNKILEPTNNFQKALFEELKGRIKKDDSSVPVFHRGYWYYTRFEDQKEYPIHCRKNGSMDAAEEVMLNVNILAESKAYYSASGLNLAYNNNILAFAEDTSGRRIYTIRFLDLSTQKFLEIEIPNTSGGTAWSACNRYLFYTAKNEQTLLSEKIYRFDTQTKESVLVYHEKDPSYYIGVGTSKSDQYIFIGTSSTESSHMLYIKADEPLSVFKEFIPREKKHEYSVEHYNDRFYIVSNLSGAAKNFALLQCQTTDTSFNTWQMLIEEREDVLLEGLDVFDAYLVVSERSNCLPMIRILPMHDFSKGYYLKFTDEAYVAYTTSNIEFSSTKLRYAYSSPTTPLSIVEYDFKTGKEKLLKVQEVIGGHNPADYISKRFTITARDGEEIPVTMVFKGTTLLTSNTPLLLYAYGSYGHIIEPWFSTTRLSLLNRGFAFAIAHIRGGEIKGRKWYDNGRLLNKLNTFNDYIDVAKGLVNLNFTSPEHLYAMGGSAGGLLMGAVANMAPDLFNGMVAQVPFVDVINTMLDESIPLTTNEFDEWGNPKDKVFFDYIMQYSPYDNVENKTYPNLLVTTGLHDSQVQYWEPAKWVAKMREMNKNKNLVLLKCNMEAGHGGASGRFKQFEELALEYAFLLGLEGISK